MGYELLRGIANGVGDRGEVACWEATPVKEEHRGARDGVGDHFGSVPSQTLERSSHRSQDFAVRIGSGDMPVAPQEHTGGPMPRANRV